MRCYLFEPLGRAAHGVLVVVPGLHYAGPDDPRLDRFCRVLASAGLAVVAPFLGDYSSLVVATTAAEDTAIATERAIALAYERHLPRPALFSISFGSTPAIEVAADPRFASRIGALVIFGGFRDFHACIRFAVSGRAFDEHRELAIPHDPLNVPAVFINVAPHLDLSTKTRLALTGTWLEMARRTWGRPELRPHARRRPIADDLAAALPSPSVEQFLIGCGLAPGAPALLEQGLCRAGDAFAFTDPAPRLERVRVPVVIAHGKGDDVIPFIEAHKLGALLPHHQRRVLLTGMYGHTGSSLPSARAIAAEVASMTELLYALVDAPHEALSFQRSAVS